MAMQFIQDDDGPEGMGRVVDEETGLDRVVYDPELASQLRSGAAPTSEQQSVIDNAADSDTAATPDAPALDNPQLPGLPTLPGQAPAVSEQRAAQWAAAQAPRVVPTVRASGSPPPPPSAPQGTVLDRAVVKPGTAGFTYDKSAEEARGDDLADRTLEQSNRQAAADAILNEQQIEFEKQKNEGMKLESENRTKSERFQKELDDVVTKEINPNRIEENQGFFGSLLGLVGQTLGYLSTPDSGFGRLQSSLNRRTERDIELQKDQKNSMISNLTRKLGSSQQAENHYRAQVNGMVANMLETRMKRLGVANQYGDKIQELRDQAMSYNEAAKAASFGKPGEATYTFAQPKPVKSVFRSSDSESKELEGLLGPQWEKNYEAGMNAKVQPGENSATVSMAMPMIAEMDNDLATLDSLAAANGGTIPMRGVLNVPKSLIGPLSRMGYKSGMQAEEAQQLLTAYVLRKARSYGGAVTESDAKNAEEEFGKSSDGLRRGIKRMRDGVNNGVRSAIATNFRGNAQRVYDISLRAYGGSKGSPEASGDVPFVKETGKPKPDAPPKPEQGSPLGPGMPSASKVRKGLSSALDYFSNSPLSGLVGPSR